MYELIDSMVKAMEKDAVVSRNKAKNAQTLRKAITELAAQENAKVPAERRVTQRDVETVAARSLNKTAGLERSSRYFAAYKDVASFITLATTGNAPTRLTTNRDLLPVGHPLSTRKHAMTASAYSETVARWIAADPRIHDDARSLVASVYMLSPGSVEYSHALTRLQSLEPGMVPRDMLIFENVSAITAAGFGRWLVNKFGGGNSSIARSLRAKKQLRDREGQFAEQGGGMQFYVRLADGTIKSKVGSHAGNAENGTDFLVEISGDPDIEDGIYSVPANITKAVKAIIPGDDAGGVSLPEGVDAVDVANLQRKDVPDGWKLIREKKEGETGPDKVYATDDGYEVEYWAPGNFENADLQKVHVFNKGLMNEVPGQVVGNFTPSVDVNGKRGPSSKFTKDKPFLALYRVETPETKRQAVLAAQRWSDVQEAAEADQDKFEKYYDAAEKNNAEKKEKQEKAAAESKAQQEAYEKQKAETKKQNDKVRAEIENNLAKGLDPFGNKIPDGWTAIQNDYELNPPSGEIKRENTVAYERKEQGYSGRLFHTADGGLKGLYQNQEFKDWDEAEAGFAETVEADVNARREAALDAVADYDESGELRSMIENGATGEELLEKLSENEKWKQQKADFDTSWAVDLPQKQQKDRWAEFEKKLNSISNIPKEFEGVEKASGLNYAKVAAHLKVGEKIINKEGNVGTITKITEGASATRIFTDADSTENGRFYDYNEVVTYAPSEAPQEEVKAELPEEPAKVEAPTAPAPAKTEEAAPSGDIEWILPDGAFNLYRADEYEPEGRIDQESPDYTDDPKVLANKFSAEELKDALAQAIIGVKDYATEFLDELMDLDDEDEEEGAKKKPGPKKKKPKSKQATGFGQLDFAYGDEFVPAEAIYSALKEQGEDAEMIAAELYDLPLGESKNVDMLEGLRSPEEVRAQEPSVVVDDFDQEEAMDVANANIDVARGEGAEVAAAAILELEKNGEPNPYINDIATDLNSTGVDTDMQGMLDKYIALALSDDEDENQGYRALHALLLSADGGLSVPGEETMLRTAIFDALKKYNGSDPSAEEVEAIFEKYGYYPQLIASKKAFVDGQEGLEDKNSLAGAFYRLMAAGGVVNTKPQYRGIQVTLGSDDLEKMTNQGGFISFDGRSFSDDKAMAGKFAGAFGGNEDKAAVIFTVDAGKGKFLDITKVSPFPDERESLMFGNFRIADVQVKVNPAGKTLYNVKLEALDNRSQVLEGFDDDYKPLLIENEQVELPEAYYSPAAEAFEPIDLEGIEDQDELDAAAATNPLYIARAYEVEDLIGAFRGAIEDGTGKVQLIDDDKEYTADVEAIRDALQIQGIDTNEVLKDVANAEPDVEAEDVDEEPIEPVADSPLAQIIEEFGQEYDLENFEQVGPQQGSNKGGTFKDAEGNEYYVKEPKSELHRRNELLASAFYKLLGVNAAEMRFGSGDDGVEKIFSTIIPGQLLADIQSLSPETKKQIQEGFAVDAWLANWDVAGLVNDNIIVDEDGNAFRIDTGGSLLFRAMGAPKGKLFGNEVNELDSLRNPKMNASSAALFGDMTDEDIKNSAAKLLDISHSDIDELVDATLGESPEGEELKDKLKARRQFILEKYGLLGDDTSLIAETTKVDEPEAPEAEAEEPEQPTPPAPEVPSEAPGNPYVTSDGVPIEPGMQLKYKKTGETVDFVKYDKGNSSYVYVKMADGSIKVKSTKQLESVNGNGGPGGETPTPEPEAPSAPEAPQEPTPEPEPEPETPLEPEAGPDLSNYGKVDIRVDMLQVGDLLPQYYPIKNAEANLLKKREADPNFELPPTDEIIGTYKASMPKKRGIKVRNLKTGKERYFEVNSNAKIYDVRRQLAEKPTPEATPEPEPEVVEVTPEAIPETPEATPETPEATPAEPEITAQKEPVVIDTTGTVDDAVEQFKAAIEKNETVSFFYNGKVRNFKPESVWENPKNGKINVYGEDLGDGGKKKNFTVQLIESLPDGSPNKPEAVEAQTPEVEPEPKKLQFHAQWIKDVMASKGVPISDEKAVEIRDIIDNNQLLEKWSSADEKELIDAIDEALGPDWNEAVGNTDFESDDVEDPLISDEQRQIIIDKIQKLAGIQGFPTEKFVNQIADPSLTEADGAQILEELEQYDSEIGDQPKVQAPSPSLEDLEEMEGDEAEEEAPALQPGAEVTDKKGNKGTVLKGPNKDNYVFVQFEDGKTGWRSAGSVSTTGEFNEGVKKAAPKKVAGKITPAGTKAVFVENPGGWDTSDFENVPALSDAIALVQNPDDKFAAMKGASAAIDADSIEDLDVRIMRVRNQEGTDGLRLKFKLTSWAGNARVKELMDMTPDELKAAGITKDNNMTVDRIDVGPDGIGQISKDKNAYQGSGVTWTITTPEGVVVKIYRANYDATSKVSATKYSSSRSFHNLVQIQAPADATNEQIADALKKAGVSDVRPATKADAQILVENRLMSIFDGKVDATKNPKGKDREDSLARIKAKYGITPDDVVITTGASGRIETRLSPEGAKKIVDATGSPTAIQHNITIPGFYGQSDEFEKRTDWIARLIGTPQGGLLSTTTRWTEGIGASGMSSAADVGTGGADYVFTKPVKVADAKTYGTGGVLMYFDPVKVYQRLDFYANSFDAFGKRQANQDVINAAKVGAYELMFKHRLSFDDLDSIVVSNQATRTAVIQKLRQMGINEIGGRPLEAVIIIGSQVKV